MTVRNYIFILGLFLCAPSLDAQEDTVFVDDGAFEETNYDEYSEQVVELPAYQPPPAVEPRPIDEQIWKKASGGLDYSADKVEEEEEEAPTRRMAPNMDSWNIAAAWWGKMFQVLAIIIALAGIAYGIYRMLQAPKNNKVRRNDVSIESDNLEEYLLDSDLDVWLREALAAGNLMLAVRIHFLQMIKKLALSNHLTLSMEKTNRDYLRELRGHRDIAIFRKLTLRYEEVWYGNRPINKEAYESLAADFKSVS
ncbi:MAG: DUF4129 domain-containing protein [Saprospiraceae bacterium]|nr:DUF4129 domain-containing protein [Saprospiraceae bacterium]